MTGASLGNPPISTDGTGGVVMDLVIDGKDKRLVFSVLEARLVASLLMVNARDAEKEAEGVRGREVGCE